MSRIKLITLDLDNTLWDVDSVIVKAEQDLQDWLAANAPESLVIYQSTELDEIRQQVFALHQQQAHDLSFMRTEVLYEVMRRAGRNEQDARRLAEGAFDIFFAARNRVQFFPGAHEMLEALRRRYTVYALTNGNADIHRAGLGAYLQGAFSSADVGVRKPHQDMFLAPLNALGLEPAQAIHVGDHLVDDISGAHGVGMHTVWVNLTDQQADQCHPTPTREVTDLVSVAAAIEEIAGS